MTPKIDLFCQSSHSCFDNFGVKKHVLWTFQKLFRSCSASDQALLSDLNGQLLGVFSARKVEKCRLKSKFWITFCPQSGLIQSYFEVKKHVFWTFQKWYWSCSGVVQALVSDLKGQLLSVFSAQKVDKWHLKTQ